MSDGLQPLQELTRLVLDTELAKLRRISDEVRVCKAGIDRLAVAQAVRSAEVTETGTAPDLALQTGQDARWQAWIGKERARLATEAAMAAARREAQRQLAERAFGRAEALARVRVQAEDARRTRLARRSVT